MRILALAALALLGAALVSVGAAERDRESRATFYVFGTLVEVVIRGTPEPVAEAALERTGHLFSRLHRDWHAWKPGALGDVNAALATGRVATVTPELAALLRQARDLSCASGGLFEPGMGRLIALWGFQADTVPNGPPPDGAEIAALQSEAPHMARLQVGPRTVSHGSTGIAVDLGGVAKGAALDLADMALQHAGIDNAMLNAGGDVNVIGSHGGRPWRVAIRDPFDWSALAVIALKPGEVLYTSGNYERYFEHSDTRFSHILDPRSGHPVQDVVSVSVLHRDGALADAAATALSVAGPVLWPGVARAMGVEAVLVVDKDGRVFATAAMADRLRDPPGRPAPAVVPVPLPQAVPAQILAFRDRHCTAAAAG